MQWVYTEGKAGKYLNGNRAWGVEGGTLSQVSYLPFIPTFPPFFQALLSAYGPTMNKVLK